MPSPCIRDRSSAIPETYSLPDLHANHPRSSLFRFGLIFAIVGALLFLAMPLRPNFYDESLVLTAAMRVEHGQIPYRDFYANYGPAQFYVLAGLFKAFGASVLVERLFDLCLKAGLVAFAYELLRTYCRKWIGVWTCVGMVSWLFALNSISGTPIVAVALVTIVDSALLLPVFAGKASRRRMGLAGALAGLSALFRYDTGVALLLLHTCLIAIAVFRQVESAPDRLRIFVSTVWPYLLGFSLLTFPVAVLYLLRAPFSAVLFDIVTYPRLHYHGARNLPFPRIHRGNLDDLAVYLPVGIFGFALFAALWPKLSSVASGAGDTAFITRQTKARAFFLVFGSLSFMMYFKGFVRISPPQLFACILPCCLLVGMLLQYRLAFPRTAQILLLGIIGLSALATIAGVLRAARVLRGERVSIPQRLLLIARHRVPPSQVKWCAEHNPLTRGMCFTPDEGRLRAVEYLQAHTAPGDSLFVGVTHHDRIFANDNMIYFATPRLPATAWSHFDPGLQNDPAIQSQMIEELRRRRPPYIVLDSGFEGVHEPNDSSRSTGATALDDYLHQNYYRVETFTEMSVWRWAGAPTSIIGSSARSSVPAHN